MGTCTWVPRVVEWTVIFHVMTKVLAKDKAS